ncbi:MAG: hypothetical protein RLZZ546_2904 [Bacteroidota bacterium]|jgi:hypothetical protein
MKKLLALLLFPVLLFGQEYQFKGYTFSDKPYKIPEQFANDDEIIIEKNHKIEVYLNEKATGYISLYHERILLQGDDAVERNNRIYIPFRLDESLLDLQVRVTKKDGTNINFDKSEIKEEVDTEKGLTYKYFAVKGLEKGAIIEKIFVLLEQPRFNDTEVEVQENKPILNYYFELIYPKHLEFIAKSYNGLPPATVKEEAYKEKNSMELKASDIPEYYSKFDYDNRIKNIQRLRFKLENNLANGNRKLFNYKEFASHVYNNLYQELTNKELKEIESFIKINNTMPVFDKIREIEHKVKTEINFEEYYEGNKDFTKTFKVKKGNETDLVVLFVNIFRKYNIKHELVFTSNRYRKTFDDDFETTGNLSEVLFYFPELDMYMYPKTRDERMPIFPYGLGNTKGLFIKEKEFGGTKMGIGKVEEIKLSHTTLDTMIIKIDMTQDVENPSINTTLKFGGYAAGNFQPIKDFVSPDQYTDVLKQIAKNYTLENTELNDISTENDGVKNLGKLPFVIKLKFNSPELVQKAGESYLVKIGETIGRQIEMYDSTERNIPVEIQYPHYYYRKIELLLPMGYKISNPEITKMYFETIMDGKKEALFESDYKIEDNKLSVSNVEYYSTIEYPISVYKSYREVINAAADFNKLVLVLKKQQ